MVSFFDNSAGSTVVVPPPPADPTTLVLPPPLPLLTTSTHCLRMAATAHIYTSITKYIHSGEFLEGGEGVGTYLCVDLYSQGTEEGDDESETHEECEGCEKEQFFDFVFEAEKFLLINTSVH